MTPLHGAVAVAEHLDAAAMAEYLRLDVARPLEVALAEDGAVAERSLRLASSRSEGVVQVFCGANDPHPPAAAPRGRLDEQRKADLLGRSLWQRRDTGLEGDALRGELVATEPKRLRRRPHPDQARGTHGLRKRRALGDEPVPGVDCIRLRLPCRANVLTGVEVRRDLDRLVGRARMKRAAVVRGHDGDRLDAEPRAGAEDAHGDLAPICDEQ